MLNPDSRRLFTDVLVPPLGFVFESGVAATYSLDVATLLSVPVQIALPGESVSDGVALLDSLRKTTSRLRVFCERGRMLVPRAHAGQSFQPDRSLFPVFPPELCCQNQPRFPNQ